MLIAQSQPKQTHLLNLTFSFFALVVFTGCSNIPNQNIPKTPEQYQISGVITAMDSNEHMIKCPSGEVIGVSLNTQLPEITFDILSSKTAERIFIGSQFPPNTKWESDPGCDPQYTIRVYNSAPIAHLPVTEEYTLSITVSD